MKATKSAVLAARLLAVLFLASSSASAQQKTPPALRQPSPVAANDTILVGTVVSFNADSTVPPIGAHVVVQTSAGTVDVHLGKAALLKQSDISLEPGDAVRITGSNIAFGESTVFAARVLQKGAQSVTLRSTRGIPLGSLPRSVSGSSVQQKEGAR
jgi:hypothetical protein